MVYKAKINIILTAVIVIFIGVYLAAKPGGDLTTAVRLIGALLVALGLLGFVTYFRLHFDNIPFALVASGAFIFGTYFTARPFYVEALLPQFASVLIILNACYNLIAILDLKKSGEKLWIVTAILAVNAIAMGILVYFNPFETTFALVRSIGFIVVYNGATSLIITLQMIGEMPHEEDEGENAEKGEIKNDLKNK